MTSQPSQDRGDPAGRDDPAELTPYPDGPLVLRGSFRITDIDGREIPAGRRTVALCRCGRSSLKPFCDGSHRGRFRASGHDQRPLQGRLAQSADAVGGEAEPPVAVADTAQQHRLPDREPGAD